MSTVENMGQDSGIEMPQGCFSGAVRKLLKDDVSRFLE